MFGFKIAAAQTPSIRGDIDGNLATHAAAITAAANRGVSVLIFPELSLTGYEPDLAAELAMQADDSRLTPLAALARQHQMVVVVGAPLCNGSAKPALGAIVIDANGAARTYRKMHLGASERVYFEPGDAPLAVAVSGYTVGIALCADSSQPAHPQAYADLGAHIYAAGVFLNAEWYATDAPRLASYAARYRMLTVMANHAASVGAYTSVGKSAIWAPDGALLAQAEGSESALLIAASSNAQWCAEVIRLPTDRPSALLPHREADSGATPASLTPHIGLQGVAEADLPIFFEHQSDGEASQMADFPARGWDAFLTHWTKILADSRVVARTILFDGAVAGNIVSWEQDGKSLVGYWIGKEYWGQGIAAKALSQFQKLVQARPLYAFVAKHNVRSIRVLEKCGFTVYRDAAASSDGSSREGEELAFRLDAK